MRAGRYWHTEQLISHLHAVSWEDHENYSFDWVLKDSGYNHLDYANRSNWMNKAYRAGRRAGFDLSCRCHSFGIRITLKS